MKINEIICESTAPVLYHYSPANAAAEILESGEFTLANAVGKESEEEFIPTIGELHNVKKQIVDLLLSRFGGLTNKSYERIVNTLRDGTPEEKSEVRYTLKLRGFTPEEIQKITKLIAIKPRKFMPYFLSATRSRTGDYHRHPTQNAVLFSLDRDYLQNKYVIKPIDYYSGMWRSAPGERSRESEDRIFSKSNTMPVSPVVKAIDVYLGLDSKTSDDEYRQKLRSQELSRIMRAAHEREIPITYYATKSGWKTRAPSDRVPEDVVISRLLEPVDKNLYSSGSYARHIDAWWELLSADNRSQLSDDTKKILYDYIQHPWDTGDEQLRNDLHNARPGTPDYPKAVKLVNWMVKHNIKTTRDLHRYLRNKWADKK